MPLTLTIENETGLPDGGPLTYTLTGKRGIDIGRDSYLDWALPDPTKTISGKHAEIRYRDGGYWLHDVSRNGTFLNRSAARLGEPHRLRSGDRIEIGRYIIAVRIDGEEAVDPGGAVSAPAAPGQYWESMAEAAPPISPRDLRPPRESRPVHADFRDWAVDLPAPSAAPGGFDPFPPPLPSGGGDMGWAQGPAPLPPAPEPYLPVPTPRRPGAPPAGGGNPWDVAAGAGPASGWDSPAPAGWDGPTAPPPLSHAAVPAYPPAAAPSGWDAPPPPSPPPADWAAMPAPPPLVAPPIAPPPPPRPASAAPTIPPGEWGAPPSPPTPPAPPAPAGQLAENPWGRSSLTARPPEPGAPAEAPGARGGGGDFLARFAKGAGISPEALSWRDPGDTAEEMGELVRMAAESVKQLLAARTEAKRVARTGSHTTIQALDNNPLKFSPTPEDALRIMLGRPSGGYLDARRAFAESFKDLKSHQVKTYSAMQHALRLLTDDLDPKTIEEGQGGGGFLGSKKAKLWDLYKTRWETLTAPHEDGMVDAYMMFFAECYDRGGGKT